MLLKEGSNNNTSLEREKEPTSSREICQQNTKLSPQPTQKQLLTAQSFQLGPHKISQSPQTPRLTWLASRALVRQDVPGYRTHTVSLSSSGEHSRPLITLTSGCQTDTLLVKQTAKASRATSCANPRRCVPVRSRSHQILGHAKE